MLRVEGLKVTYGDFVAVSSASLYVAAGQTAAVIGANGAGKSSLLNAVAGLHVPSAGRVVFDGEDITGLSAEQTVERGLALVPQGGACFPRMNVRDNLLVGCYLKRARARSASSLEQVYDLFPILKEKSRDPAGTLSGGQRQMLAIGRALMSDPRCLMFDELSLGLAPIAIRDLYRMIERIRSERGLTVVLVEQNTERALQTSDVSYVMRGGETVLSGASADLSRERVRAECLGVQEGDTE